MKKFVLSGLSLVLLIACLVMGGTVNSNLIVGPGTGTDLKVNDVEELSDILLFLLAEESNDDYLDANENGYIVNLLSSEGDNYPIPPSSSDSEKLDNKYTSAIVTILTDQASSSRSSNWKYTNGLVSHSHSFNRELTMYITEECTLYHSKGVFRESITTRDEHGEETEDISYDFDMRIVSMGGDHVYVNFRNFMYSDNSESRQIKYDNIGKWIEMPHEVVDELVEIEAMNYEVLQSFGDILNYLKDSGEVDTEDTYIVLDEHDFATMDEDILDYVIPYYDSESLDVNFSYDLTTPSAPYISFVMSYNDVDENESVTVSNMAASSSQFLIRNINNTVVVFDKGCVDFKANDEKEFDKLFIIE